MDNSNDAPEPYTSTRQFSFFDFKRVVSSGCRLPVQAVPSCLFFSSYLFPILVPECPADGGRDVLARMNCRSRRC